jgi:predicted nucleic acid binding AN1-type Zn finger protein
MTRCQHVSCKKKLFITDFPCKCEKRFCVNHRLPESHQCVSIEKEREAYKEYLKDKLLDAKFTKLEKV